MSLRVYILLNEQIKNAPTVYGYAIITDMEPKLPALNQGHEQTPGYRGEYMPAAPSIERRPEQEKTLEKRENPTDLFKQADNLSLSVPALPVPVVGAPEPDSVVSDGMPLVANDDDLIEQEWVKKAKEIIADTKDDPYRRELEVGKLQADYLKKRYGKELGAPQ